MDMNIRDLPVEIQNKIFFMCAEHPLATIFKKHIEVKCLIVAFSAMVESEEHLYMRITDKDNMNKELQYRNIFRHRRK